MSDATRFVTEFHYAFGSPVLDRPTIPPTDRIDLRDRLLTEEFEETLAELQYAREGDGDIACIAKELADVLYVVYGTALEFGIDLDAVLAEVHRSNMAKVDAGNRMKALKPEGWTPPDIAKVLGL